MRETPRPSARLRVTTARVDLWPHFGLSIVSPRKLQEIRLDVQLTLCFLRPQEWREKMQMRTILEQPQPVFAFAKRMYGHGVPCFTKGGQPVWVDKIADLKKTFSEFKVTLFPPIVFAFSFLFLFFLSMLPT